MINQLKKRKGGVKWPFYDEISVLEFKNCVKK